METFNTEEEFYSKYKDLNDFKANYDDYLIEMPEELFEKIFGVVIGELDCKSSSNVRCICCGSNIFVEISQAYRYMALNSETDEYYEIADSGRDVFEYECSKCGKKLQG